MHRHLLAAAASTPVVSGSTKDHEDENIENKHCLLQYLGPKDMELISRVENFSLLMSGFSWILAALVGTLFHDSSCLG